MNFRPNFPLTEPTKAGVFSSYEVVEALKAAKKYTHSKMQELGFSSVRTIQNILNQGYEPQDVRGMHRKYFECHDPPIEWAWDREVSKLREWTMLARAGDAKQDGDRAAIESLREIGRTFMAPQELRQCAARMRQRLRQIAPVARDDLKHEVGKAYYSGRYCMTMAELVYKAEGRSAEWREWLRQAARFFTLVARVLVKTSGADNTAATLLTFKAVVNAVASVWNLTPPERRDSARMRKLIKDLQHLEGLIEYASRYRAGRSYAINAMAIASRHKMREQYEVLHPLIVEAAPEFKNPIAVRESGHDIVVDGDFDDYICWWKEKNP